MKTLDFTLYFLDSANALCVISFFALFFKLYLVIHLMRYLNLKYKNSKSILFLNGIIVLALIGDFYCFLKTLIISDFLCFSKFFQNLIRHLTNGCNVLLHLSLSIFIESLLKNKISDSSFYKNLRFFTGICLSIMFMLLTAKKTYYLNEIDLLRLTYIYIFITGIQTLYYTNKTLYKTKLPKLLEQQIQIFVFRLFTPFLVVKLLSINPLTLTPNNIVVSYPFMILNIIVLTYSIYFCAKRLIGLRFLNMKDHVETAYNVNFVNDFKQTLEHLSHVSNLNELKYITLQFFTNTFNIPSDKVHLFIRDDAADTQEQETQKRLTVEHFFNLRNSEQIPLIDFLCQNKILIKDELEFSAFYEPKAEYTDSILFLNTLNAELFLPIYDKKKLIAYIIIDQGARPGIFYNNVERDEMLVFAAYLNSIINLVRNRNFDLLLTQAKELKEELYQKHQEIHQYKESIRSFFRNNHDRKIGILTYKNRHFTFGNPAAQEFIGCDPNTQKGHSASLLLKKLVKDVQNYQSVQSVTFLNAQNNKMIISAFPHAEYNDIIFILHHPDIDDTIKLQENILRDPSQWDYLLYLETTKSGQLINQLIPGNGQALLHFKIDLLKIALSKKAVLLNVPEDDLHSMCELIHNISLRRELHVLSLTEPEKNYAHAIKLFGINPLFTGGSKPEPLLEKLDGIGNLYIENVHFLSLETQNALADFIQLGAFHVFKSEQRFVSDVRIVCSSTANLADLVEKNLFSSRLLNELKKTSLTMPSLKSISSKEFDELANNIARQVIKTPHQTAIETDLSLNEREKNKLHTQNTDSLQTLRKKIYGLLIEKTQKQPDSNELLEISPAHLSSDPELTAIISLGKDALKDRKKMEYLWNAYKNQQKIASLLGVNRSSVNRRCKDYHLM